jgi:hypothetical protein
MFAIQHTTIQLLRGTRTILRSKILQILKFILRWIFLSFVAIQKHSLQQKERCSCHDEYLSTLYWGGRISEGYCFQIRLCAFLYKQQNHCLELQCLGNRCDHTDKLNTVLRPRLFWNYMTSFQILLIFSIGSSIILRCNRLLQEPEIILGFCIKQVLS